MFARLQDWAFLSYCLPAYQLEIPAEPFEKQLFEASLDDAGSVVEMSLWDEQQGCDCYSR